MSSRRSQKRSTPLPLPASVQFLQRISFDVAAEKKGKLDIQYTLILTHRASASKWTQPPRSFEDYHQFRHRLLKTLKQGHVCPADCAYLYTFVKSYFPKKVFFGNSCPCLMERRRERLVLCLTKLQKFLLTRENHGCLILLTDVAKEVEEFILGDVRRNDHPLREAFLSSPLGENASRTSSESMFSTSSEEEDYSNLGDIVCECICSLCDSRLEDEAFATPVSSKSTPRERQGSFGSSTSTRSSTASSSSSVQRSFCSSLSYTTTLGCGHTFHDECIVPKLNDAMECPTCGHAEQRRV